MATGQSQKQGLALAGHNYVGEDQIWKDHIDHETGTARGWQDRWKFMATDYRELIKDEYPQQQKTEIPLPKHLQIAKGPPLHECVKVLPSVKPVPRTTSGEIGWRSGVEQHKLDKYGRYCRPKGGLIKQLNWPNEAIG